MRASTLVFLALLTTTVQAATFIVPSDRVLVGASKAIVVAVAGESHGRWAPGGWIETVTELRVEEAIKGPVATGETIRVTDVGGCVGELCYTVSGTPRFAAGERVLLFLETNRRGEWTTKSMAVGKFTATEDLTGRRLLLRDAEEIVGWDVGGSPHHEPVRWEEAFLQFVRAVARGLDDSDDYLVENPSAITHRIIAAEATGQAFAPSTYLIRVGTLGLRWPAFPAPAVFLVHGTQPGASSGGLTALQRGLAAWTNNSGSNIVYRYGGPTAVSRSAFDGVNAVLFNDPSNEIEGTFSPVTGGVLAHGGPWSNGNTHTANGEQYFSILEADLVVQDGITGAGLTGNGFDHVLTHELGHTLGLRHSDQDAKEGACLPPLDCATNAIMNSSVSFNSDPLGANLQAWDIAAIDAVYGTGGSGGPPPPPPACVPPRITTPPQTLDVTTAAVTFSVTATGDAPLHYQWYSGTSGNTNTPIESATSAAFNVKPAVTSAYWVRITNGCDPPADSGTVFAIVNSCPPVTIDSQSSGATLLEGSSSTLAVFASGGTVSYQWFTGASGITTSPIPGANSSSVTVTPAKTTSYWARATNTCGSSADSNTITLTILPCTKPAIVVQPAGGEIITRNGATLFAAVIGTEPIAFQWYEGTFPDTSRKANAGTSATLAVPALVAPASYWLHVSNDCGSADSNTVSLTIVSSCTPPSITSQPQNQSVPAGSNAIVSVAASGPSLSYQWYQGSNFDFTHPLGGNAPALFTPPLSTSTQFWVRISNPCGSVDSAVATVSISNGRRRAVGR
jgi:hypothetical protein